MSETTGATRTFARVIVMVTLLARCATAEPIPPAWGDQGDGTYKNPVLPGDYQNTDVVRVGDDYYYISATKALSPGMAVLHSKDLVNWRHVGHVVPDITVFHARFNHDRMEGDQRGVWAGAIAHHGGKFYVYFTTPDEGLYVSTATDPAGPWAPLTHMMRAPGWDDPCPFWDDDGQPYLVLTQFARDPANGKTYNTHLYKMTADALGLVAESDRIIHQSPGAEASKLFKRGGVYYHFFSHVTPEGRIPMMHRAKEIAGPYETRQLLHVNAKENGEPNQGTLLETPGGQWVFLTHHGRGGWEGRPASLLPVTWAEGWPLVGSVGADGIGNMVWSGRKPIGGFARSAPQTDDEFDGRELAPQWEWYFQPRAGKWSLAERPGFLRLHALKRLAPGNLRKTPNILTQRPLRADGSAATVKLSLDGMADGQTAGLCFLGKASATIGVTQAGGERAFVYFEDAKATAGPALARGTNAAWLRVSWNHAGLATFQASTDGERFTTIGNPFQITSLGSHLGAKLGIYTTNDAADAGHVDVDWFHYSQAVTQREANGGAAWNRPSSARATNVRGR